MFEYFSTPLYYVQFTYYVEDFKGRIPSCTSHTECLNYLNYPNYLNYLGDMNRAHILFEAEKVILGLSTLNAVEIPYNLKYVTL